MAPSARSRRGATADAAPLAQSTTTGSPSSPRPSIDASTDAAHRSMSAEPSTTVPTASPVSRRPRPRPAEQREQLGFSSASSTSSESFWPPAVKSFTPLSANELCEAEITAPAMPSAAASHATAGVGATPSVVTSTPSARQPGDQGRLEQRPRSSGVAPHDEAVLAEHAGRGAPERQHDLRREVDVRHAPHPVRPELQHPGEDAQMPQASETL